MDSVFSPLQTTVGHRSGGDSNHPCTGFLDQKDVNCVSGFIIGEKDITDGIHGLNVQEANYVNCSASPVHPASLEAENCYVGMDCTGEVGGNEELPRVGFSDQKDKALLSVFKNGKIGEYSTTHELGLPGRISSPYDDVDKQLKEIFDSVHAYIRSQVATGNYQALNHEFKNGKGIRADYLRSLVHRHPKFDRVASPKACSTPHMAGACLCLPDTAEESSKMVDPDNLVRFSNTCLTYDEIFEIKAYFANCTYPKDASSQEALYRDIKHGRGLYAQYLGAKIRVGIGGSMYCILEEMEKGGVCLKALAAMVSSETSPVNISPQNSS